jgi:hypothetical protein
MGLSPGVPVPNAERVRLAGAAGFAEDVPKGGEVLNARLFLRLAHADPAALARRAHHLLGPDRAGRETYFVSFRVSLGLGATPTRAAELAEATAYEFAVDRTMKFAWVGAAMVARIDPEFRRELEEFAASRAKAGG